ncbi:MAG: VCBS repeat-containing protein, partial [Peptococcaceae bacterium]
MTSLVALLLERGDLDGPVLVGSGRIAAEQPEVAAAGQKIYLFSPWNGGYTLLADVDAGTTVFSLAVGLPVFALDNIILGTADRLLVYGGSRGAVNFLGETEPEAGALFTDLALGDLDGDGREEIVAAAEGNESLYIYRLGDETGAGLRLELLAVRVLPGPAQKVTVLERGGGQLPLIVAAYRQGDVSGLLTLSYTETGFAEGPAVDALPAGVTALAAGDFTAGEGEEPAWGGDDGRVRIMAVNAVLETALVTDNLGSAVSALAAAAPAGEQAGALVAGTPEGFLFGYRLPAGGASPDWAGEIGR